jgi:hypothetical protein
MKPKLKLVNQDKDGPSLAFLRLTRNPFLPQPGRFEPTRKRDGDVII